MAGASKAYNPRPRKSPPTQQWLRELLHYDPLTGAFRRRLSDGSLGAPITALDHHHRNTSYLRFSVGGFKIYGHQAAWLWLTGVWPDHQIDHKDGDGTNNRENNLRRATQSSNTANSRRSKSNTSGFKGVSYHQETGKWRAAVWCNYRKHSLGLFKTPQDAHAAYMRAARELHGEFARTA